MVGVTFLRLFALFEFFLFYKLYWMLKFGFCLKIVNILMNHSYNLEPTVLMMN